MHQTRSQPLPKQNTPRTPKAAAPHGQVNKCTQERRTRYEEQPAESEWRKQKKVQLQKPARKFEDSDFAYVDQELPSELFKAFKTTFVSKPVPEQSISNERLQELGFEDPDKQLWLRYCIEQQLAYW